MAQDNSDRLIWLLAGATLGATLALLYAPQSGRDTRRLITKKARQGRDIISDASEDLADKGRDLFEKGRRVADEAVDLFERGKRLVEG
jgi:gas vesicle protein